MLSFRVETRLPPVGGCEYLESAQRHDHVRLRTLHHSLRPRGLADGLAPEAGAGAVVGNESCKPVVEILSRQEKRKELKKLKRSRNRQQAVLVEKAAEEIRLADPLEQARIQLLEQQEAEALITEQAEHDKQERLWLEREEQARQDAEKRREEELARKQEEDAKKMLSEEDLEEGWEYVEDGPAEIIWEGNEIIVKKSKKKVLKAVGGAAKPIQNAELPYSNPLPPQVTAFAAQQRRLPAASGHDGAEQSRNFGTEQDKTNCPFHIKTGVCRFGVSCSRAHVYPEKSCTLLVRNMYNGPGLAWEHEDGLEHTEEEVYEHFETFYDDVHEEFQKFGELVNFKVCRNGSSHLRGNVYAHYRSEVEAVSAYVALNGRYYASKQISCEFVGVTRWRVAICGEYMKAHYKPCSRGTVCNFLHCFRNPRGEYTWADWDLPAPRSWQVEMNQLFGGKSNHCDKSPDDEGYRRRPVAQDRRHQSRDKLEHHRRRYSSSDGSSGGGGPEVCAGKRKHRPPHTSDWFMDTSGQDSSGNQYNWDLKGLDERQDRFEDGSRSHRKHRHWAGNSGKPLNDFFSDSEEDLRSRRLTKSWTREHRRKQPHGDDTVIHSSESGDFGRAANGYEVQRQPSHSGNRQEDARVERTKGHSHRSHPNTTSALEGHRRASRYSDSDSEVHKCRTASSNYHNASNSEDGRTRNGHGVGRKSAHMSIRRVKEEAGYYDEDRHWQRHKHRRRSRSSSISPIPHEVCIETAEQKRLASCTARSGAPSGDSDADNRLARTGAANSRRRQSPASVKRRSRTKALQPSQEKVPDKARRPRDRAASPSASRTGLKMKMSTKDSFDLDDRWGR